MPLYALDLSIIVVSWNTCSILRNCLASIFTPHRQMTFEVIVVDNASEDGSAAMVSREFPQVVRITNKVNVGFAAANNQAIAIAKGRYVLLLNSDTVVLADALEQTVCFADKHPEAAVVGCRVLNPDGSLQPSCFMAPSILNSLLAATYLYRLFPHSHFFGRERMTWWMHNDVREVEVVSGCFMLVRRQAIEKVGVMDDRFFMYAEETDWCHRFRQAGYKIMFTPQASIIHLGGASSSRARLRRALQYRKSIRLFCTKNLTLPTGLVIQILTDIFLLTRLPWWAVQAPLRRLTCHMGARQCTHRMPGQP